MDIKDFYNSILNIMDSDKENIIKQIVLEEKENLSLQVNDFSGFCKYIANQIKYRLENESVKTYLIDLNKLVGIDHVSLIAEYKYNGKLKRILIDPTYIQFVPDASKKLVTLDFWPASNINKFTLDKLLLDGFLEINDNIFNDYINSFLKEKIEISLESYLFDLNYEKKSTK